jgi:D-serine deaminase-like pyridoxal phosphate-dependent protein
VNILDHFNFENVGSRIEDLETPVPLVDIGVVEHTLKKWQARIDFFA